MDGIGPVPVPGGQALENGQGLQILSDYARAGGDGGQARAGHGQADDMGRCPYWLKAVELARKGTRL